MEPNKMQFTFEPLSYLMQTGIVDLYEKLWNEAGNDKETFEFDYQRLTAPLIVEVNQHDDEIALLKKQMKELIAASKLGMCDHLADWIVSH